MVLREDGVGGIQELVEPRRDGWIRGEVGQDIAGDRVAEWESGGEGQ